MTTQQQVEQLLAVIERIHTRLALSDSDTKFQELINTYLPKLLSLLLFDSDLVRNKIVQTLTHVNKRVKANAEIQLPFAAILDIFLTSSQSPFLRNFSILYLDMGFERMNAQQRSLLLPLVCEKLRKLLASGVAPVERQPIEDSLLRYFLQILPSVKIPTLFDPQSILSQSEYKQLLDEFKQKLYGIIEEPENTLDNSSETPAAAPPPSDLLEQSELPEHVKTILTLFRDVMLFRSNYSLGGDRIDIPNGMSIYALKRIVGDVKSQRYTAPQVASMKSSIIDIVMTGIFADNTILPILIIGAGDSNDSIAQRCDNLIKKLDKVDLEDSKVWKISVLEESNNISNLSF